MPLINSKTGKIRKQYTIPDLENAARYMRAYNLISLHAAGSGHSGGTLSIMDIAAALYLHTANLDPENPSWDGRDRIIWSTGHKAPALYVALAFAGFFDKKETVLLRKLYSPYQGHPHWLKLEAAEFSTGSLGQGLSIGAGTALSAKLDKKDYRTYVFTGDGEHQEGQIWEAVMEAGHYHLDNLVCILDKNRLQIDGYVKDVMDIDSIADKYRAFNWDVTETDGHSMEAIVTSLEKARNASGKPCAVIAHTVKGKGVDFMENVAGWHGRAPDRNELDSALQQLGLAGEIDVDRLLNFAADYQKKVTVSVNGKMPEFGRGYWWNETANMQAEMMPTRMGFGKALDLYGDDERIVCLGGDISGSINISEFYKNHPGRKNRFFNMGIAEQSATSVAAGFAKEGKIPVFGTYGCFSTGRNLDQIRTTVCYGNFNVLIAGAHGGISVGPDGATHQALEDLFLMTSLPNMRVTVPCDYREVIKMTRTLLFDVTGPKYIRFAREATPVVTNETTPLVFGKANVARFRRAAGSFSGAFEWTLSDQYNNEHEDLSILACGPSVPEAMRAAWILKAEYGLETRIVNFHTIKPLDTGAVIKAAEETGFILTVEEHQVGGFGNWIAKTIMEEKRFYRKPKIMKMIGIRDRFGESGYPWELIKEFEIGAEHIARTAKEISGYIQA